MASLYILHSSRLNKFYVGSCKELVTRVEQHLSKYFPKAFTSAADDWVIYLHRDNLKYAQARKIERHIKRMKSKKFIENLARYPEMMGKLIALYQT